MSFPVELEKYFFDPQCIGVLTSSANIFTAQVSDSHTASQLQFQIEVKENIISQVKFLCQGSHVFIALADYVAQQLQNQPVAQLKQITRDQLMLQFKLEKHYYYCALLIEQALRLLQTELSNGV